MHCFSQGLPESSPAARAIFITESSTECADGRVATGSIVGLQSSQCVNKDQRMPTTWVHFQALYKHLEYNTTQSVTNVSGTIASKVVQPFELLVLHNDISRYYTASHYAMLVDW